MAKIQRYNPPPNWPTPPPGWSPPPGWQPDPSWGPPPTGWQLWTSERANPKAWGYAFAAAGALTALFYLLGLVLAVTLGGGVDAASVGTIAGEMVGRGLVTGLILGLISWNMTKRWALWAYPLVAFGLMVLISAITSAGRLPGA